MLKFLCIPRHSAVHGLGCFALEDIPKGSVVWHFDGNYDIAYTEEEFKRMPRLKKFALDFWGFAYSDPDTGEKIYVACGDATRHINHSIEPNIEVPEGEPLACVATRDIKAGEEILIDYYTSDLDAEHKLSRDLVKDYGINHYALVA